MTIGKTVVTSDLRNGREPPGVDTHVAGAAHPILGPLEIEARHGVSDRVDVGARLFLGIGLLADGKLNLLPARFPAAVAIAGGLGGGVGPPSFSTGYVLAVPMSLLASVDVAPWLTPYASIGYRGFWIWGADDPTPPGSSDTSPTGRGEALLLTNVGIELRRASGRGLLVEYGYLWPWWHDPGHGYTFVASHVISIGFRTGAGPAFER